MPTDHLKQEIKAYIRTNVLENRFPGLFLLSDIDVAHLVHFSSNKQSAKMSQSIPELSKIAFLTH